MLQTKTLPIERARALVLLIPALMFVSLAFAQPTVCTTNVIGSHNYSDAVWSCVDGSSTPPSGANVVITNATITMDSDVTIGTLTISSSGYVNMGSATITIEDQLIVNELDGINDDGGTSTVIFTSTVASDGSSSTVGGSNEHTLYNVVVASGSTVAFGAGDGVSPPPGATYITNELKLDGGAVVTYAPFYGAASTLVYDDTHTSVGPEWTAGASSGKGVPHHVSVGAGSSLDFASTSNNYTCTGNFTVDGASASLDVADMTGTLTVDGNLSLGTTSAVSLALPSAEGASKIVVGGDLTFGANTTITGDEANLEVSGNLANSVTGAAFGLLKMNGSADQDVTGSKITVDSLVVANTQNAATDDTDVDFQADVDITPGGVFNPIDGTAKITGTFTMNSDATGTARIATLADAGATSDVDGDITFERFIPANSDGPSWLSAGNYVVGATRADWTTSFGSDFHMVFDWDETHVLVTTDAANGANAWTIISDASTVLHNDGIGYYVYTSSGSSPTLTSTGTYHTSDQSVNLTFSNGANQGGGWHVVSNPFASPIDGSQFLSDNGLVSRYYMYDNASDQFKTDLTGAPATIDVGQSFWIQVSGAGDVDFNTTQITHGTNSFLRDVDPAEIGIFGLSLSQSNGLSGHAYVRLHEDATEGWEWELDATRLSSGNPNSPEIYTVLENGHELHINALNFDALEGLTVPFVIETGSEGSVYLQAAPDFQVPEGLCAFIEDSETGERVGYDQELSLLVELDPQTTYADRFTLVIMGAPAFEATSSHCEGGVVHFIGEDAGLWNIEWSNSTGDIDGTGCVTGLEPGDYIFDATNPLNECRTSSNLSIDEVCMGDFNVNGERDITDLLVLLVGIQPVENFEGTFPDTDCDCDGAMTTLDLLMFLPQFGNMCE